MSKRLIFLAAVVIAGALWLGRAPVSHEIELVDERPVSFSRDLSIEQPPIQKEFDRGRTPIPAGDFWLTPVADFEIEAKVLGRRNYRLGQEARLSPMDLAVGWGPMSDQEVLEDISVSQSGRFGRWSAPHLPLSTDEINHSFANIHIIPAGAEIAADLDRIDADEPIRMSGYLVDVHKENGWRWDTSTSRTDTGDGACEILLVTRVAHP